VPAQTLAAGLAVTYRAEYRRCGNARCRPCRAQGAGHGPYWYAYWRQDGRLRKRYLGKDRPPAADAGAPGVAPGAAAERAWADPGTPDAGAQEPARAPAGVPVLRVRTLGGFAVWRGQEHLPAERWSRRKAAALFKLLLDAPRHTLPSERAADLLWPEAGPTQAAANLRSTMPRKAPRTFAPVARS
jgi:hypothetical protein